MLMPMAPAFRILAVDVAAASGVSPYPASRSIDIGTDTAAVIRDTRPVTISNGTSSPSVYPSADATAALLVATAGEVFAMAVAVATSQALNRTSGSPFLCRPRNVSAYCCCVLASIAHTPGQRNLKDVVANARPAAAISV